MLGSEMCYELDGLRNNLLYIFAKIEDGKKMLTTEYGKGEKSMSLEMLI